MTGPAWERRHYRTELPDAWPRVRRGIVVRLAAGSVVGWGEAAPMPGYSEDSFERAEAALDRAFADPRWTESLGAADLHAIAALSVEVARTSPSAACALESAALDVIARRTDVSFAQLLAGAGARLGRVAINGVVPPTTPAEAVGGFRPLFESGVRAVKVKVGRREVSAEAAVVAALRATFGDELELRLDANGAWAPAEVAERLAPFAYAHPRFCEQPSAPGTLSTLGDLPLPFAADESSGRPTEIERLLDAPPQSMAAIVLKPMAVGGALRCMDLARRAQSIGLPVVVTHFLDGPVGAAVAAEFASAAPGELLACGLAPHAGLAPWEIAVPQHGRHDAGSAGRPGLGVVPERIPG